MLVVWWLILTAPGAGNPPSTCWSLHCLYVVLLLVFHNQVPVDQQQSASRSSFELKAAAAASAGSIQQQQQHQPGALKFVDRDEHVYFWFPLLAGLSELTFDPRPEIRRSALEVRVSRRVHRVRDLSMSVGAGVLRQHSYENCNRTALQCQPLLLPTDVLRSPPYRSSSTSSSATVAALQSRSGAASLSACCCPSSTM